MINIQNRIYQLLEKAEDGDKASRLVDIAFLFWFL